MKRRLRITRRLVIAAPAAVIIGVLAGRGPVPASADAGPSASISPATGLHGGQVIRVTGRGFPGGDNVLVAECAGTVAQPPPDATECDGNTADVNVYADRSGNVSDSAGTGTAKGYKLTLLAQRGVVGFNCDAQDPCVLYVGVQLDDFTQPHTFVPLAWAADALATSASAAAPAPSTSPATVAASPGVLPAAAAPGVRNGLASTGAPRLLLPVGGAALLAVLLGTLRRRRALEVGEE